MALRPGPVSCTRRSHGVSTSGCSVVPPTRGSVRPGARVPPPTICACAVVRIAPSGAGAAVARLPRGQATDWPSYVGSPVGAVDGFGAGTPTVVRAESVGVAVGADALELHAPTSSAMRIT